MENEKDISKWLHHIEYLYMLQAVNGVDDITLRDIWKYLSAVYADM